VKGGAENGTMLDVRDLTITLPDGRKLFRSARLQVRPGEFILLAGHSGSGKSTLLRLIAGLRTPADEELEVHGRIEVEGAVRSASPSRRIGIVFQHHALFDELTAVGNVQFAIDHRAEKKPRDVKEAQTLLQSLRVPTPGRLDQLSGGERQRVAVARTLAMDPPLLLFDEPTTGLDPGRARAVADLIRDTHRRSRKTVIVVTHDFVPFLRHQPRLVLLDSAEGAFRDVDPEQLQRYFDQSEPQALPPAEEAQSAVAPSWRGWRGWIEAPGEAVWTLVAALSAVLGGWTTPRWKLRYLWHYMRMVTFGTTALYVALAGAMLGFVFVFFSFSQLPYAQVTVPLLTEEFLAGTGYSTFRVVVPLLISVLLAGKCGASVAADVGARRLTYQYDAMRSFGVRPEHYLYGNVVLALVVGGPLLTAVAYGTHWYASLIAYLITSDETSITVFQRSFFAMVWPEGQALPRGFGWVVLKTATSGLLIAALAYAIGSRPKASSTDVSRDVGLTIFWSSLAVLLLHSCFSFVEF